VERERENISDNFFWTGRQLAGCGRNGTDELARPTRFFHTAGGKEAAILTETQTYQTR